MKHDPYDFSGGGARTSDHESRPVERLRPGQYSAQFLEELRSMHTLFEAPPQWDGNRDTLSSELTWVLYPNGELERLGYNETVQNRG
jgi:hypothetical protein